MIYDVDYFINKFEVIPEERFFVDGYYDENRERMCALGHCIGFGVSDSDKFFTRLYGEEFSSLLELFGVDANKKTSDLIVADINDGKNERYPQPTPKQRILAALYDIKAMTEPKDIDTGKKERIVYVAVPATITEQSKDLVLS